MFAKILDDLSNYPDDALVETITSVTRISFHSLRHTAASLWLLEGVLVEIVSKRLGHTSAKMTLDTYHHVFEKDQQVVADVTAAAV